MILIYNTSVCEVYWKYPNKVQKYIDLAVVLYNILSGLDQILVSGKVPKGDVVA